MSNSLPQHVLHEVGGTVAINIPVRPASTQTVSCYGGGGNAIFETAAAVLSTISTTLTAAASARDTTITVASTTGITKGAEFRINDKETAIAKVTPTTLQVTLVRPLAYAHASGVEVAGYRLTYFVSQAQAATKFWDGRLEWLVDDTGAGEELYTQAAICTDYRFYRHATSQDWADEDSKFAEVIDDEHDIDRALDNALGAVITRLAAMTQGRAWTYIGPPSFTVATILAAQMALYRPMMGEAAREMQAMYKQELGEELERVVAGTAWRDADQDGAISEVEQVSSRSRKMIRG